MIVWFRHFNISQVPRNLLAICPIKAKNREKFTKNIKHGTINYFVHLLNPAGGFSLAIGVLIEYISMFLHSYINTGNELEMIHRKIIPLLILIVMQFFLFSCARQIYEVTYPTLLDGKYDSEFPYRSSSKQL